jgi:hypothetical protein
MTIARSRSRWVRITAPLLAAVLFGTAVAGADSAQKNAADQLFDEAKTLMDAGNFKDACPKLEESLRLDPGDGTFLRLAFCYENVGKLATARTMYREALANAKKANNTQRIDFATKQLAGIEPRVSKVTIVITGAPEGLEVKWDGNAFVAGTVVPVDGGKHSLSVSAPGKKTFTIDVVVAMEKDVKTVTVPVLEDAPEDVGTTVDTPKSGSKVPTIIAFSAAGVFIGGAVVSRILMGSAKDDYTATCAEQRTPGPCADDSGKSKVRTWETLSFVGAGLGLAALGTGIVLLTTGGSSEKKTGVVVSPTVGVSNGISVMGAF